MLGRKIRVLVASETFKGTLTAFGVGEAVRAGLPAHMVEVKNCPLSDGGAGFLDSLTHALNLVKVNTVCIGPLGSFQRVKCYYGVNTQERFAVLEMAQAGGYPLVPDSKRNPLYTTSFGVGEQLMHAWNNEHVDKIYVGIGGSATNDAAIPMLQAMGLRIRLKNNKWYDASTEPLMGGQLIDIAELDFTPLRKYFSSAKKEIVLVCDITNPFVGPTGATAVYGPQKGATTSAILERLEAGLLNVAALIESSKDVFHAGKELKFMKGAGGAGGMSGVLHIVLGARWEAGATLVADLVKLPQLMQWADVIITGEGSYDDQTFEFGKTLARVEELAVMNKKRLVVICGRYVDKTGKGKSSKYPVITLVPPYPVKTAMTETAKCVTETCKTRMADILGLKPESKL